MYSIAPRHDLARTRQVHWTMLKPVPPSQDGELPSMPVEPHSLPTVNEEDELGRWVCVDAAGPSTEPDQGTVAVPQAEAPEVAPPASAESFPSTSVQPSTLTDADPVDGTPALRRTSRTTAGRHGNPYHLPVSAVGKVDGATNSRVLGSSSRVTVVFQPWC